MPCLLSYLCPVLRAVVVRPVPVAHVPAVSSVSAVAVAILLSGSVVVARPAALAGGAARAGRRQRVGVLVGRAGGHEALSRLGTVSDAGTAGRGRSGRNACC